MKRDKGVRRKSRYFLWQLARRLTQFLSVCLFLFLFIKTDYTGSDTIEYGVNILFRIDPLLAVTTMVAAKTFIALLLPSLCIIGLSFIFGRSFCGWLCPLGGLLDSVRKVFRVPGGGLKGGRQTYLPKLPVLLFLFILIAAVFGLPLVGFVDPFSILVRGLVQVVYPGLHLISDTFFTYTYHNLPTVVNSLTEPVYGFLQATILPFEQRYYELTIVSGLILALVFVGELAQSRFFCRNICPLGGMLGLVSFSGTMAVTGGSDECRSCRLCATRCRMGAIDEKREISASTCILCMDCMVECPQQRIYPLVSLPSWRNTGAKKVSLSRRQFLGTVSAGCTLTLFFGVQNRTAQAQNMLVRPPGALIEKEFLARCVRCGECIQVCITNGLQPTTFQAGLEGLFTPYLQTRSGYCEFNCTLCGQVCPTGAIQVLDQADKHVTKIGHAWFDKNICLPFAKGIPCIVCEEHCPTPEKAIRFNLVEVKSQNGEMLTLKQPYIVDELCIGCGICETKCPLPGRAAIYVNSAGEGRDPDNELPGSASAIGGGYF
ncbi:4Fe-4S binding protein [Desulforhopalus sp. 52FAK]